MDAHSSQSFTRTSQGRRDEYGEYEIIEYDGYAIKNYLQLLRIRNVRKYILRPCELRDNPDLATFYA